MLKKKKFLIGGIIIVLAIVYLGYVGFQGSALYYYTVNEITDKKDELIGENLRVNGEVASGSIKQIIQEQKLEFTLLDFDEPNSLSVVFQGIVPDTFKDELDVVVEGNIDTEGVFHASSILTKCPSKYTPEEY